MWPLEKIVLRDRNGHGLRLHARCERERAVGGGEVHAAGGSTGSGAAGRCVVDGDSDRGRLIQRNGKDQRAVVFVDGHIVDRDLCHVIVDDRSGSGVAGCGHGAAEHTGRKRESFIGLDQRFLNRVDTHHQGSLTGGDGDLGAVSGRHPSRAIEELEVGRFKICVGGGGSCSGGKVQSDRFKGWHIKR